MNLKEKIFYLYVALELIFYVFFTSDIIGINIKKYIYSNFPLWTIILLVIIQRGILSKKDYKLKVRWIMDGITATFVLHAALGFDDYMYDR